MDGVESPWLPRETRRQQQRVKREGVLSAAGRIFGERGYKATRIDDIAEALHVTKPTVYYYYRTKEALFLACVDRAVTEVNEAMGRLKSGASIAVRVSAFLDEYVSLMTSPLGKCLVTVSEFDLRPAAGKRLRNAKRETDALLHALIEEGMRKGAFTKRDPNATTFTLFGAMNSVARWHSHVGELDQQTLKETIRDLLIEGLRKR